MRCWLSTTLAFFLSTTFLTAYESMHEKTPVGKIKVIDLPTRLALEASSYGNYFDSNNGLFRKLFQYISFHNVSMTTPVEADINPGKMRFFVGIKDAEKKLSSNDNVKVIELPKIKIVSIGVRGSYTKENFNTNKKKLENWLSKSKLYKQDGEAYGVYWNGPFIPGFFKRSEVHIPITLNKRKNKSEI